LIKRDWSQTEKSNLSKPNVFNQVGGIALVTGLNRTP